MAHTFTEDIECKVSAKRMWFGAFKDAHNCMPKAWPDKVAVVEYAEGPVAERDCVRTMKFHKGHTSHQGKQKHHHEVLVLKEKLEEVDEQRLKVKARVMEGGFLGIFFKSYSYTFEFKEGAQENTCMVRWTIEYEAPKELHQCPDEVKEGFTAIFKSVEAYLLTHNDLYLA